MNEYNPTLSEYHIIIHKIKKFPLNLDMKTRLMNLKGITKIDKWVYETGEINMMS